jgi:Ca2+-transporting ATPase
LANNSNNKQRPVGVQEIVNLQTGDAIRLMKTHPDGLSTSEANSRLSEHGPNVLIEKKRVSFARKFIEHLSDLFSVLLIIASILAAVGGMLELSLAIFGVVLVNTFFSLTQEWRAEKAMEALKNWMPEQAKVLRDGELKKLPVRDIVPGDIIVVEEGDRIPADAYLIESYELWTNNVPLTGESEPQPRIAKPGESHDKAYLDAQNLVFMSTSVAKGRGKAVVFSTGMDTKFGQIAGLTQEITDEPSPLQKEIAYTAKVDFIAAIAVGVVFFAIGSAWVHLKIFDSILFMIGVMVASVPEGLQVTVSSALGINVLKMAKEKVLVRRLSAVQTLGSVTVICTDKTGTITTGEMTVKKIYLQNRIVEVSGVGFAPIGQFFSDGKLLQVGEIPALEKILEISALANTAKVERPSDKNRSWGVIGDPTDGALLVAALKYGLDSHVLLLQKPIIHMIPFDSKTKRVATFHKYGNKILAYTKGAPRTILNSSSQVIVGDKVEKLTPNHLSSFEEKIREFGDEGLRVIAVAYKELPESTSFALEDTEKGMILVGLVAMKDPPRPEVKDAVSLAKQAGIKIVIITGDYGPTAQSIAEEVGIVSPQGARIITGLNLDAMSDQKISEEVRRGEVIFSRVSPEQKLRIVKALKKNGEIVAVTGDGANDAPSLKDANIGVAMGVSGTDVAREASDMVLLDDSFASIVRAVESGRTIYENIRRFIVYVFAHNWAELVPFVLYILLKIPLPLLVVQVLAIDLVIEIIPSLALSREPPEPGIMQEMPRSIKERIFNKRAITRSAYVGLIIAAGAMFGCLNAWHSGGWHFGMQLDSKDPVYIKGTTMMFAGIVVAQVGNVIASRTRRVSILKKSLTSNKWIWPSIAAQLSILSALVYVPPLQRFFGTTALGFNNWIFLLSLAVVVVIAEEVRKFLTRRFSKQ